ncbi:MAG TPA: hypothetical protein PKL28_11850 [Rhodocyclaceae bacterium]|jgi:hypothetical protein|nr:hypothetical protein [Nitrospira sp.]HNE43408.1 hypothetical protein [Rhodocyclaceae bacterium]HNL20748.1 hypothetical protein [Rhodocyclaceae bacterium]HNM81742.1 hypothetical protein [Rhodocyclaceae bacterium]
MNTEKLTKDQKRHARDRARAAEKERFDREMGRMPTEITFTESNIYATPRAELQPIERAPAYMRDSSDPSGNYAWNDDIIKANVKKAAKAHSRQQEIQIKELQEKYPDHWGKRGGAKYIAMSEHELDPESAPSIRTVQEYFKKTRG